MTACTPRPLATRLDLLPAKVRRLSAPAPLAPIVPCVPRSRGTSANRNGLRENFPGAMSPPLRRDTTLLTHAQTRGDPKRAGPHTSGSHATAAHRRSAHTHPEERAITVTCGTYRACDGDDARALIAFPAGSFYSIAADLSQFGRRLSGKAVFRERGTGPRRHTPASAEPAH